MTPFSKRIYSLLKQVPKGRVTTYKALANALGTKAYQAVGTAMKNNPYAPQVPCHRVVSADGSIGGFKGHKSGSTITEKIKMLRNEGVEVQRNKLKDFSKINFQNFKGTS